MIGRAPTEPGRAKAAKALVQWGYQGWDGSAFLTPQFAVGAAKVQGGVSRNVAIAAPRNFALTLPKGSMAQVNGQITFTGPLRAPLARGQEVARLEIQIAG